MGRVRPAAVVIAVLLVAGSVSYSCARTYTFVDEANAPVDPIYVAFYYTGSRPNPVHSVSYHASTLRVIRSDAPASSSFPASFTSIQTASASTTPRATYFTSGETAISACR